MIYIRNNCSLLQFIVGFYLFMEFVNSKKKTCLISTEKQKALIKT